MSDLTPDRLAALRRVAEAATPGPWEWRMSKDGRILDLITLETGYNEEIITPSHINAWLQVKGGLKDFIPAFAPATALALLDEIERLRREREVLAEAVMGWQRYLERDVGTEIVHVRTLEAHGRALILLGGEEGGGDDGR